MAITEQDIQTEAVRIRNQEQYANDYHQYATPDAFKNKFVAKSDEHYRSTALQNLQRIQANNDHEVKQENAMWESRNAAAARRYAAEQAGKGGGYRKSRRSRTLKRVQKRKQTRRHRHRHRR